MATPIPRMRRKEASAYLEKAWGLAASPATLAKYATVGGGPVYNLFGRFPLYTEADLDAWAEAKLGPKGASTTEHGNTQPRRRRQAEHAPV